MRISFKHLAGAVAGIAVAATLATAASAQTVTGAGASFPAPIYLKWAAAFKGTPGGATINYNSIGSGGGIAQIKAKTVTFGATDAPLKPDELQSSSLVQFPTVIGGVVPVINLPGIGAGKLKLDGPTLAGIFLGDVTTWNDAKIKALNPGVNLPSTPIAVVHRSDGSGTTFIFSSYLSKVSDKWSDNVGFNTAVDWPVGVGARGNEGVAGNVAQTAGAIGYVEYAYALQNHLAHTLMVNKSGATVSPTLDSFKAAAASADWSQPGFYTVVTNAEGAASWPIAGATFILIPKNPPDAGAAKAALSFFKWAYANGGDMATALEYVPLSNDLVAKIQGTWTQVQGWNG
jgi:phosphate transport system substrate-binding protein